MDYVQAPKEVRNLVKSMRAEHFPKFEKAQIVILMRLGKWDKWGQIGIVGKKQRASGVIGDYVLTFNGDAWTELKDKQKEALVFHELYHMARKKTKDGTKFRLRHHDSEEFVEVVKRFGAWTPSLQAMKDILAKKG